MTRLTLLLSLLLFLTACGYTPQAVANVATASPKPTREATATPVPLPTIGYEQTAIIAVQTSNEAVRVNAMITAEYEQRIQAQYQMTAQHEADVMQVYSWTQQAAPTVIPLTATQQAIINQRVPTEQAIKAAQMTATVEYPSLLKKTEDAKNYAKWSWALYPAYIFIMAVVGLSLLALIWYIVNRLTSPPAAWEIQETHEEEQHEEQITQIEVHRGAQSNRYKIPLSKSQLTELAQAITSGVRNFEINAWQRDGLYLKSTKDIQRVRGWACKSQLVTVMPNNELAPKDELLDLLYGWLENQTLPDGVEVEEVNGAVVAEPVPA